MAHHFQVYFGKYWVLLYFGIFCSFSRIDNLFTLLNKSVLVTEVTSGIKVSVDTNYSGRYFRRNGSLYLFSYNVTIENQSQYEVQLLGRHWYIFDSTGGVDEVVGDGVIGLQPVLEPGQSHTYTSGCNLTTPIGKMEGTYQMERLMDGRKFEVNIPSFTLVIPHLLN